MLDETRPCWLVVCPKASLRYLSLFDEQKEMTSLAKDKEPLAAHLDESPFTLGMAWLLPSMNASRPCRVDDNDNYGTGRAEA